MPILNYTTKVSAEKTLMEIQRILVNAGAKSCLIEYDAQQPSALSFQLFLPSQTYFNFRLPAKVDGVLRVMEKEKVARSLRTKGQAQRVAWRIVKDWLEAQLALVQSGQAEIAEVMLPYIVTRDGRTLYQLAQHEGLPALESGA